MRAIVTFLKENLTFLPAFVSWRYVRAVLKPGSFKLRCALLLIFAVTPFVIITLGK